MPTTKRRADPVSTSVPIRNSPRAGGAWVAGALAIALWVAGCKPAAEPPRRGGTGGSPAAAVAVARTPATEEGAERSLGTIRITAPDVEAPPVPVEPAQPDAMGEVPTDAAATPPPGRLSAEILALIAQPATPEAEALARQHNAKGLALHRRLEIPAAIREYREALKASPGHVASNYNLACALALQGDMGGALHHLEIVAAVGDPAAKRKLESGRTDPDLAALQDDPDYRRLTGWLPVQVSSAPDSTDPMAVGVTVALLRKAFVPASDGGVWSKAVDGSTLFVRVDDPAAAAMADTIMTALTPQPKRIESRFLSEDKPLLLVLAGGGDARPASTALTRPEDAVDLRLRAEVPGGIERLHLKKTGFFSWERVEDNGRRTNRTGRYQLDNGALAIDYRQVIETPREGDAPDIQVDQGRRSTHKAVVEDGALMVDGVAFRP